MQAMADGLGRDFLDLFVFFLGTSTMLSFWLQCQHVAMRIEQEVEGFSIKDSQHDSSRSRIFMNFQIIRILISG
jgi:hypothetical protein